MARNKKRKKNKFRVIKEKSLESSLIHKKKMKLKGRSKNELQRIRNELLNFDPRLEVKIFKKGQKENKSF